MDDLAILIPCYNEEITIEKVIHDFRNVFPDGKIYVYDNNSTDKTASLAEKAGAVVKKEYIQGKGAVVRSMFRDVDAKCYLLVDGDDTYSLENAKYMVDQVLSGNADMVIGDRLSTTYFESNTRRFHNFGNRLVRDTINRLFHCDIKDIMTGFRTVSFEFAKTFPVLTNGFEIETEMTIHAVYNHFRIKNVKVNYRNRPEGSESKLRTFSDGLKVIKTIISLYKNYKPLQFFGSISFILAVLSVCYFIPVFQDYLKTGLVKRFPTLIVCGFVMIASMCSLFSGLILSNEERNARKSFELYRHVIRFYGKNISHDQKSA